MYWYDKDYMIIKIKILYGNLENKFCTFLKSQYKRHKCPFS